MKTVLISGASGLIGGHLAAHLAVRGWTVIGTGRRSTPAPGCHHWYVRPFGTSWNDIFKQHPVGAAVHCAYDPSPQSGDDGERATGGWIEEAAAAGVRRQILLSSISARADSCSRYGREKHRLEGRIAGRGRLVLRPGLVIGPGGLFGRMARIVQRFPVIPLIAGGRNRVYFTGIDALCRIMENCLAAGPGAGAWNVQQPEPTTMRELLKAVRRSLGVRRVFMPVPYPLALAASTALPGVAARAGVSRENVAGLKQNDVADLPSDYQSFGERPEDIKTLVNLAIRTGRPERSSQNEMKPRGETVHADGNRAA